VSCPSLAGNRNALLALHFGELEPQEAARLRAHVEGCLACGPYLADLTIVEHALTQWKDHAPPAMADVIVDHAVRVPQAAPKVRPRARRAVRTDALPLLGLLPVMAAIVILTRAVAAWLPALSFWPRLEDWPTLAPVLPIAAAGFAMLVLGGLATLAAAPALVLESRRQEI
jgi:hypothetical protein